MKKVVVFCTAFMFAAINICTAQAVTIEKKSSQNTSTEVVSPSTNLQNSSSEVVTPSMEVRQQGTDTVKQQPNTEDEKNKNQGTEIRTQQGTYQPSTEPRKVERETVRQATPCDAQNRNEVR